MPVTASPSTSRPSTPSWLNPIEIWFSILARKLLRRGNFTSREHLQQRIENFIAYFNATMAKPIRWTMKGKPLVARDAQAGWDSRRSVLGSLARRQEANGDTA
jgi:hypothetical protein